MEIPVEVQSEFEMISGVDTSAPISGGKTGESHLVRMVSSPVRKVPSAIVLQGRSSAIDGQAATARALAAAFHVAGYDGSITPETHIPINRWEKGFSGAGYTDKGGYTWMATHYWGNEGLKNPLSLDVVESAAGLMAVTVGYLNQGDLFKDGVEPANRVSIDDRVNSLASMKDNIPREYQHLADRVLADFSGDKTELEEQRIIHGDAKADNFLYKPDGTPNAVIDFELVDFGDPVFEPGDLSRSYIKKYLEQCRVVGQEPDLGMVRAIIEAVTEGYNRNSGIRAFTFGEVLSSSRMRSIELAARYLVDAEKQEVFTLPEGEVCLRSLNYQRAELQVEACALSDSL